MYGCCFAKRILDRQNRMTSRKHEHTTWVLCKSCFAGINSFAYPRFGSGGTINTQALIFNIIFISLLSSGFGQTVGQFYICFNALYILSIKISPMKTLLITILRLFSSCPGILKISGKIVSDKTDIPIEAANIELFDIDQKVHQNSSVLSDKNGRFTATSIMRKMIFGFPKYQMKITKSGYHILEISINLKSNFQSNVYRLIEK